MIRDMLSFCLNIRWKSADALGRDRFASISRHYPVWGPVICGAAAALACEAGSLVFRVSGSGLLSGACAVLAFYQIRGVRLFDGFCDLSEGLTYARQRGREAAWDVIRTHSNGAFAILWALILLLFQFAAAVRLSAMPQTEGIAAGFAAGALSAAGPVLCHTGKAAYNPGSAFAPFLFFRETGSRIRAALVSTCCALPVLFAGSGPLWFRVPAFVLLVEAAFLSSLFLGRLVMRELNGFNGDVFGFVCLVQHALLTNLYVFLSGVVG